MVDGRPASPGVRAAADPARSAGERARDDVLDAALWDAAIGMCVASPDGAFLVVNPALCAFFGLDAATLMRRTWQELTHPDDLEGDLALVQQVLDGDIDRYRLTKRYLHADGSVRSGDLSVSAVRAADGEFRHFVAQIIDVSARVSAEEELAAAHEDYRLLAENSSDVVYRTNALGICTWISPSVETVLGWTPTQVVGAPMVGFINPEDAGPARDLRLPALSAGSQHPESTELRYAVAAGGWRWMSVRARVLVDDAGAQGGGLTSLRDIEAQVTSRLELQQSRQLLRATLDTLIDPWVLLGAVRDEDGGIVDFEFQDANAAACRANGLPHPELVGRRLLDLFPEHGPNGLLDTYAGVVRTGEPLALDDAAFPDRRAGGAMRRFDNRAVRVGDGISLTWRDVTDRYDARQRERDRARRDPGLPNRTQLMEHIDELAAQQTPGGRQRAILFCDVDRFKPVNDRRGHAAGDLVLRTVADRISAAIRSEDLVARLGGDEFVVILQGIATPSQAVGVAEKIRESVARPINVDGDDEYVTLSIGLTLGHDCPDPGECLHAADAALYRAKAEGRNRVVLA